jgi:hypothetical protein
VSPDTAPTTALVTGWDRLAVIVLGGAGCALSASALMQMAIAIHIRPTLCWLFPLVVDGFIAYGIRALLVLRNAPLRARLYVWTLVGTATGVSVWANALHAVRLNQIASAGGLRLGDTVVAYLSTVAPLALAGAVHLYILIARGPDNPRPDRHDRVDRPGQVGDPGQSHRAEVGAVTSIGRVGQRSPHTGQPGARQSATAPAEPPRPHRISPTEVAQVPTGNPWRADDTGRVSVPTGSQTDAKEAADLVGQLNGGPEVTGRSSVAGSVTASPVGHPPVANRPATPSPVSDREARRAGDRRPDPDTEQLLEIARSAVRAEDKLTRKVVAQAIRGQKIPLSSDTLTALMAQLREQRAGSVTSSRG